MFEALTAFFDRQEAMREKVLRLFFQGVVIVSGVLLVALHLLLILGVEPYWFVFSPYLVLEEHSILSSFCSLFVISDKIDLICVAEVISMVGYLASTGIHTAPGASFIALIGTALSGFIAPIPFLGSRFLWCHVGSGLWIVGREYSPFYLLYLFLKKDSEAWIFFVLWLWMYLFKAL